LLTILAAASEDDKHFSDALAGVLHKHFAQHSDFMLCNIDAYNANKMDKVVAVYKSTPLKATSFELAAFAVAVVDSQNKALLEHVSATRLPAITCGLAARDTISLSSMTTHSTVIDLRRGITCLDNSHAEPQEIPLRTSAPIDSFLLMSAAAILILCGKIDCLKEGFI